MTALLEYIDFSIECDQIMLQTVSSRCNSGILVLNIIMLNFV